MKIDQKSKVDAALFELLANVGDALRAHRLVKRMTQEQAATLAGFSRQTLARIERGDPSVAFGQVARYAEIVGARRLLSLSAPKNANPSQQRVRLTQREQKKQAA